MNRQELALQQVLTQIEPPWNETMYTLLKGYYFIFKPDTICEPKFSEGELALILLALKQREFALHWLVRLNKWIPNHPFPVKPSIADRYEVLGVALQKTYLLCQHTYNLYCQHSHEERKIKIPYKNAAEWFAAIHWELIYYIQLGGMLPGTLESKVNKTLLRQSSLKEIQKLKVYDDNPLPNNSFFKARYLLYEAARELAQKPSYLKQKYNKEYFKPFVKALKEEIRTLHSPSFCNAYIDSDGKAVRQNRRGNRIEVIELPTKWKEQGAHLLC